MNRKRIIILLILFTAVVGFTIAPTMAASEKNISKSNDRLSSPNVKYKLISSETTKKNPNSDYDKLKKKGKYYYDTSVYKLKGSTVYTIDKYKGYPSLDSYINSYLKVKSKNSKYKIKSIKIYYSTSFTGGKVKTKTYNIKNKYNANIKLNGKIFIKAKVNYKIKK